MRTIPPGRRTQPLGKGRDFCTACGRSCRPCPHCDGCPTCCGNGNGGFRGCVRHWRSQDDPPRCAAECGANVPEEDQAERIADVTCPDCLSDALEQTMADLARKLRSRTPRPVDASYLGVLPLPVTARRNYR